MMRKRVKWLFDLYKKISTTTKILLVQIEQIHFTLIPIAVFTAAIITIFIAVQMISSLRPYFIYISLIEFSFTDDDEDGDDESDDGSDEDDGEDEGEITLSDLYKKNLDNNKDFSCTN